TGALAVERMAGNPEVGGKRKLTCLGGEDPVAAVELQPALALQQSERAGIGEQSFMLRKRTGEERPHDSRRFEETVGARGGAKSQEPRQRGRQMTQMIVRLRSALEGDAQECRKARRKGLRENRIALDDAGIAVGGLLPRASAIDQ